MAFQGRVVEYDAAPPEYLYSCPYNLDHSVTLQDFLGHVLLCSYHHARECLDQGRPLQFQICNFDMRHHVPSQYIDEHHEICPARRQLFGGNIPWPQQPSRLQNGRNLNEPRNRSRDGFSPLRGFGTAQELPAQNAPTHRRNRRNGSVDSTSTSSSSSCSSLSRSPPPPDSDE
ncbi:unnamed protein product [Orchesella dallaii]|uniref:Gametocyte-specific factor 1 n=1 Tax=Orchesella dallaii TaxID=48710 RepID=A0ABP1QU27_9HEXA